MWRIFSGTWAMMRERDLAAKSTLCPIRDLRAGAWQEIIKGKNTKIIKRDI